MVKHDREELMKYLILGEFSLGGSGYTYIIEKLALELIEAGNEVTVVSEKYNRMAHYYPFKLVPIQHTWIMETLRVLPGELEADRVIIAADVPLLSEIAAKFTKEDLKQELWKMEAIFPVESYPIKTIWRDALAQYKHRYVISEFGKRICDEQDIPAIHLPVGCDVINIPNSTKQAREELKWSEEGTIFLTIAANHERKALPLAIEAFSRLNGNAHYYIITNKSSAIGWDLEDIIREYEGLSERVTILNNGMPREVISMMYHACDTVVIPSQAEGACLPAYEAAAHGKPVICGTWTGLEDIKDEPWVYPITHDYVYRYPWGNVYRWMASVDSIYNRMHYFAGAGDTIKALISEHALNFASGRSWKDSAKVLTETYEK